LRGFLFLCLPVLIAAQALDARNCRGIRHDQLGKPAGRTGRPLVIVLAPVVFHTA